MKKISNLLFGMTIASVLPLVAGAAGTYYDGNLYKKPQSQYTGNAGGNGGGFYNNYGAGRGYGQNMQGMGVTKTTVKTTKTTKQSSKNAKAAKNQGLQLGVDFTHEFASWDFNMKNAGSKLHYDNLRWNTVNGEAAYYFGNSTPMQIKVGGKYGKQFDESPMVDDDITAEKMWEAQVLNVEGTDEAVLFGLPALSVGTSKGGSQFGFNAEFGLTDFINIGGAKITPSIGYRYFKHKLDTKKNYGLMVDIVNSNSFVNCVEVSGGEIQCAPYVGFADMAGNVLAFASLSLDEDGNYVVWNDTSAPQLDLGETYYYEQSGTSHKYETEWAGPYIALDMRYDINDNNSVNAGVEFGLPVYNSKGDQPYRVDWAHPTSVEDKGDFGDAYHIGLNAEWLTALSDSISLSLGMVYDYYHVKDVTAKTYLDAAYYQSRLDFYQYEYDNDNLTDEGIAQLEKYKSLKANGWTIEDKKEVESIYKSMGIRLGLVAKF